MHSHICFFLVQPCIAEHDGAYSCQKAAICSVNCQCNVRLSNITTNQQKVGACSDLINNLGSDAVTSTSDTPVSCNFALVTWQKYLREHLNSMFFEICSLDNSFAYKFRSHTSVSNMNSPVLCTLSCSG